MRIRVACVSEVEGVDGGVFVIGLGIGKNVQLCMRDFRQIIVIRG
jgi:hypothetical protein